MLSMQLIIILGSLIVICLGVWLYYKIKIRRKGELLLVGREYSNITPRPFKESIFIRENRYIDLTSRYIKIMAMDDIGKHRQMDLILINPKNLEPKKGSIVLFKRDEYYRLGICMSEGGMGLPPIFDGHECIGINCELIGTELVWYE